VIAFCTELQTNGKYTIRDIGISTFAGAVLGPVILAYYSGAEFSGVNVSAVVIFLTHLPYVTIA